MPMPTSALRAPGARDAPAAHTSECECFSICGDTNLARFLLRLPIVTHTQQPSPWHSYLRAVYGSLPPLPLDLSTFDLFYPNLLPTRFHTCRKFTLADEPPSTRQCEPEDQRCEGWLKPASSLNDTLVAALARHQRGTSGASFIRPPRPFAAANRALNLSRLNLSSPFALFVLVQRGRRAPLPSNTWVEVMRLSRSVPLARRPVPPECDCNATLPHVRNAHYLPAECSTQFRGDYCRVEGRHCTPARRSTL